MKTRETDKLDEATISILPLAGVRATEEAKKQLLELQLRMASSSINHEYARMEFEDVEDPELREELLQYMQECHCEYFEARSELSIYDPYALEAFEADLLRQKSLTLGGLEA